VNLIKKSSSISKTNTIDLLRTLGNNPSVPEATTILQETFRRKDTQGFYIVSQSPTLISDPTILKMALNSLTNNLSGPSATSTMENILSNSKALNEAESQIVAICLSNNEMTSIGFLHKNTPDKIINKINNYTGISDIKKTSLQNSPVLQQIVDDLKNNRVRWDNQYSVRAVMTRLVWDDRDTFATTIAAYNLSPIVASYFMDAANLIKTNNKDLFTNIFELNQNNGVKLAKLSLIKEIEPRIIIPQLITMIKDSRYFNDLDYLYSIIHFKMSESSNWFKEIFNLYYGGENIIELFLKQNDPSILRSFLDLMSAHKMDINDIKNSNSYEELINQVLDNPSLNNYVFEKLDKSFFTNIKMTDKNRAEVNKHFQEQQEQQEEIDPDLEMLLSKNKNNWYKIAQIQNDQDLPEYYNYETARTTTDPQILTNILRREMNDEVSWYAIQNLNCSPEILTEV